MTGDEEVKGASRVADWRNKTRPTGFICKAESRCNPQIGSCEQVLQCRLVKEGRPAVAGQTNCRQRSSQAPLRNHMSLFRR